MADLISREAARDVINTWGLQKSEKVRMELLHRDLDAIPAVDAVPVIRCRDCRYWRQEVGPTVHWVCAQHSFDGRYMHTTPDFFCADGVPKE